MSGGNKIKISRTVIVLSVVSLLTDISSEMLYPVMPVYLKSIGFSALIIGILEGVAEATAGFSKGYFGSLSDRTGKRIPFVRFGYLLSALSKPLLAVFQFPLWVFMARGFDRLGKGIRTSARDAVLSAESTPETKARIFGFHRAMDTAGAMLGPVAALIYLYFFPDNFRILFLIAFLPGIISVSFTFYLKDKTVIPDPSVKKKGFFSFLQYWSKSDAQYKKLVCGLLFFTLINSSDIFLLLMIKQAGYSNIEVVAAYIFYNFVYAAVSYPAGMLADKLGFKKVFIIGMIIFAVVYGGMAMSPSLLIIFALFFLYGIYAATTESVSKAWISNISKKDDTATAIGFYTGFGSIFTMLASIIAGFLWNQFNPQAAFFVSSIGAVLTALYFQFIIKHKKYVN
ncbi:MAG: MFS transporter [Ignavibacteria bacterium]|nr:MFS transporter [Ignavibacteria bacterium]